MSINNSDPKPKAGNSDPTVLSSPPTGGFNVDDPLPEAPPKKKKTWLIILIVLVVLCLCACIGVVVAGLVSGGGEFNFNFDLDDLLNEFNGFLPLLTVA